MSFRKNLEYESGRESTLSRARRVCKNKHERERASTLMAVSAAAGMCARVCCSVSRAYWQFENPIEHRARYILRSCAVYTYTATGYNDPLCVLVQK